MLHIIGGMKWDFGNLTPTKEDDIRMWEGITWFTIIALIRIDTLDLPLNANIVDINQLWFHYSLDDGDKKKNCNSEARTEKSSDNEICNSEFLFSKFYLILHPVNIFQTYFFPVGVVGSDIFTL